MGLETKQLMMMITPRIIIQEEDEEKLGLLPPETTVANRTGLRPSLYRLKFGIVPSLTPEAMAFGREQYDEIVENGFLDVADAPLSTFSVDVDTASYANVRRFLNDGQLAQFGFGIIPKEFCQDHLGVRALLK